jgi:hypothetical protein
MEKRYFQHLNPHDDKFQTVTTLELIDDTDPSFVLYYFEDGTKCNKDFIGALNEQNVLGNKELVEVSSPTNKWAFELKPEKPVQQEKIKTQSGEWVDVPTEDQWFGKTKKSEKDSYIVKAKPKYIDPKTIENKENFNFNGGPIQYSKEAVDAQQQEEYEKKQAEKKLQDQIDVKNDEAFNELMKDPIKRKDPNSKEEKEKAKKYQEAVMEGIHRETSERASYEFQIESLKADLECERNKKLSYFDINKFTEDLTFEYNGNIYKMKRDEFFKNAIMPAEEKITKKEESSEHIEIGLDDTQKNLVDNMIDMSQKEQCEIEMSLTLNLPPMSVYKLIKSVYPKGMSTGFVNIIADRLKTIQLKKAVASGLLAYYDEDLDIEVVEKEQDQKQETDSSTIIEDTLKLASDDSSAELSAIQKKKGGRPKKS